MDPSESGGSARPGYTPDAAARREWTAMFERVSSRIRSTFEVVKSTDPAPDNPYRAARIIEIEIGSAHTAARALSGMAQRVWGPEQASALTGTDRAVIGFDPDEQFQHAWISTYPDLIEELRRALDLAESNAAPVDPADAVARVSTAIGAARATLGVLADAVVDARARYRRAVDPAGDGDPR